MTTEHLTRWIDPEFLKREFNRLTARVNEQIREFEIRRYLNPKVQLKFERIDGYWDELIQLAEDLLRQIDSGVDRFIKRSRSKKRKTKGAASGKRKRARQATAVAAR